MRPRLSPVLLLAVHSFLASSVHAAIVAVVDQQQLTQNGSNNSGGSGLSARKGQTFVPTFTGLNAAEFMLAGSSIANGLQDQFQMNIRETDLSGTIIGTSTVTTLPDSYGSGTVVDFSFSSLVAVTPGNTYALELVPIALPDTGAFTVRVSLTDLYAGGVYFTATGSPLASSDAYFRVGLQAVPEPSTLSLLAFGGLTTGIYVLRRRRGARASYPQA